MLNVKKKKKLKIATTLGFFLIIEGLHCCLSNKGTVIKNYGVSFGVDGWFFIFLNVFFVILLTKYWWKYNHFGLNLIVIGGWVNVVDRLFWGYVRDYWKLGIIYNNLADWIIQIGVIIFLSQIWIKRSK